MWIHARIHRIQDSQVSDCESGCSRADVDLARPRLQTRSTAAVRIESAGAPRKSNKFAAPNSSILDRSTLGISNYDNARAPQTTRQKEIAIAQLAIAGDCNNPTTLCTFLDFKIGSATSVSPSGSRWISTRGSRHFYRAASAAHVAMPGRGDPPRNQRHRSSRQPLATVLKPVGKVSCATLSETSCVSLSETPPPKKRGRYGRVSSSQSRALKRSSPQVLRSMTVSLLRMFSIARPRCFNSVS
jgi:hypothetical protein